MRFFNILKKGAASAASAYRLIVFIWVTLLGLALVAAYPLKSAMGSIYPSSLALERFNEGLDFGLMADISTLARVVLPAFMSATFIIGTAGFLVMTFFAGGLFSFFTRAREAYRVSDFLKASAENFFPFLKVSLLMMAVIAAWSFVTIGIPAIIVLAASGGQPEPSKGGYLFYVIWALGLPVLLFVADSSRRWIAGTGRRKVFSAVGHGFRSLKGRFWHACGVILFMLIINTLIVMLIVWFAAVAMPVKGITVFLFFLAGQALFILRLFLKAWRYASVIEIIRN